MAGQTSKPKLPKGVYLVECRVGAAPNRLPLFWGERPVLIDSGLKDEPDDVILPFMRAAGLDPARLDILINSHADIDHNGGNASLLGRLPQARLACGEPDRAMVESTARLWDDRWNQLRDNHSIAYPEEMKAALGPGTRVDWVVRDGDLLDLGGGRSLQAVATPGHSLGHLAFLLRPERILFAGDGIQGAGLHFDTVHAPPQYLHPDIYLYSISRIARLRPAMIVTCHLGAFRGEATAKLLNTCRSIASQIDAHLRRALRTAGGPLTLAELTFHVSRALGLWDETSDIDFTGTMHGHLSRATQKGWAKQAGPDRPLCFVGG